MNLIYWTAQAVGIMGAGFGLTLAIAALAARGPYEWERLLPASISFGVASLAFAAAPIAAKFLS